MSDQAVTLPPEGVVIVPARFRYDTYVQTIVDAQGAWVRFDPAEIHGRWPGEKQSILLQAGRLRKLKFQTTFRVKPWMCARLVVAPDAPNPASAAETTAATHK